MSGVPCAKLRGRKDDTSKERVMAPTFKGLRAQAGGEAALWAGNRHGQTPPCGKTGEDHRQHAGGGLA